LEVDRTSLCKPRIIASVAGISGMVSDELS